MTENRKEKEKSHTQIIKSIRTTGAGAGATNL